MDDFIKQKISESASKITDEALKNIIGNLPDEYAKQDFIARMKNITAEGVEAIIDRREYQNSLEKGAYAVSIYFANHYADAALSRICQELPQGKTRQFVTDVLYEISRSGIENLCSGGTVDAVKNELSTIAENHAKNFAREQIQNFSQDFGNGIYKQIKFTGSGSREKNKNLREGTEILSNEFALQVTDNLFDVFNGKKNFDAAAKDIVTSTGKNAAVTYGKKQIENFAKSGTDALYDNLKFSGSGSRKKNRYLREGTDMLANEFAVQVTDNLVDVFNGKKNFDAAAKDIVAGTGKNFAVNYTRRQGAELAANAIKSLSKLAEKEIEDVVTKNAVSEVLKKLSNSNTLMQVADVAYDIGNSFKRWLDGEINDTQFLREVGEKGTAVIVSGVFATLGAGIAGPVGAAVGSAAGYFATNLLYGSVVQAFEEAELSRKRYEVIHAFCEESVNEMEIQRQEFESNVEKFLAHRQAVIDNSLNAFEAAMRKKDITGVCSALNGISREFGGEELPFKNRAEFDKFMLDKNSVLVL